MFKRKRKHVYEARQAVAVYKRSGRIIITPSSQTTDGVWMEMGTSAVVEETNEAAQIGQVLINALGQSEQGIPHPSDWSNTPDPTLDAAGIGSWRTFMKASISCTVDRAERRLTFEPYRNLGVKEGYVPISEKEFHLSEDAPPDKIGAALLRALDLCE